MQINSGSLLKLPSFFAVVYHIPDPIHNVLENRGTGEDVEEAYGGVAERSSHGKSDSSDFSNKGENFERVHAQGATSTSRLRVSR